MAESEEIIKQKLEKAIRIAIADGLNVFIVGMARGVDLWAGEIIIRLRNEENLQIKLIATSPFDGFEKSWEEPWKKKYYDVLKEADLVKYVSEHYFRGCFQVRNKWMVDHSTRVIAVWNGTSGGTKNTVIYAQQKNVSVINVL